MPHVAAELSPFDPPMLSRGIIPIQIKYPHLIVIATLPIPVLAGDDDLIVVVEVYVGNGRDSPHSYQEWHREIGYIGAVVIYDMYITSGTAAGNMRCEDYFHQPITVDITNDRCRRS